MVGPPSSRELCFKTVGIFFSAVAIEPNGLIVLPFVALLLAIALMPFTFKLQWEKHYPKVVVGLAAITTAYYVFSLRHPERMLHAAHEYASFIALIGSLFVVAGGIHLRVKGQATPLVNCAFLLIGALLANVVGTTGASMLLIRPWIRMNRYRITAFHIVFFIFLISNVGGCLTPIGDPPLFLGYLKGVPFWWAAQNCWVAWSIAVFVLLVVFYAMDSANFLRAPRTIREAETAHETWKFEGLHNLAFLAVILGAVFIRHPAGLSECLMVAAAVASYASTRRETHQANDFNFHPIREVAWLFLGIFATMVPALDYLQVHARALGLTSDMAFFWVTGTLSAGLDNAPTYLTMLAAAMGVHDLDLSDPVQVRHLARTNARELIAISIGAVFFGAMTYIGNGPNFMVKSIADHSKVSTPGFFTYLFHYAVPILLPILYLIAVLFFSPWKVF